MRVEPSSMPSATSPARIAAATSVSVEGHRRSSPDWPYTFW